MAIVVGTGVVLKMGNDPGVNSLLVQPVSGDSNTSQIVQKNAGGTVTFITDIYGNVSNAALHTSNGGFSTPYGFKAILPTGYIYNASAAANTFYQTSAFATTTTGVGASQVISPFSYKFMFPSSVLGLSMSAGGTSAGTFYARLYKNGSIMNTYTMGTSSGTFTQTFAKGVLQFAVGDIFSVYYAGSAAGSIQGLTSVVVEMGA